MDLNNNPFAYWAFETNLPKEYVGDIIGSVSCSNFGLQSPLEQTPWRIELFRMEEFQKGLSLSGVAKKLGPLRGWEGPNESSYLLSDSDMNVSYEIAQRILREDSDLEEFADEARGKGLNYMIKHSHNGKLMSCAYNGGVETLENLQRLTLDLARTGVGAESNKFRNNLYGYYEHSEDQEFKIISM